MTSCLTTAFAKPRSALVTFVTAGGGLEADILANLCGRGDKEISAVAEALGESM